MELKDDGQEELWSDGGMVSEAGSRPINKQ
jgi:hypothetical protein